MRKILKIQIILGVIALGLYIFGAFVSPYRYSGYFRMLIEVPIAFIIFLLIIIIAILENYTGMTVRRGS